MIGFQVNGEFLDLPENPSVELNRNSPIFQQEGFVVEDYTLPVTFPNTSKNARILGWPHVVENADRLRPKWSCTMWFNGVPRLKGELRAKNPINSRNISANFVRGISQIGEDIKERSIRELVDRVMYLHTLSLRKSIILNYVPATSQRCAIIINGRNFEGADMAGLVANINADEELTATASNVTNQLTITSSIVGEFEPFHVQIPEDSDYVMLAGTPSWLNSYRGAVQNRIAQHVGPNRFLEPARFGTFANFFQSDEEFPLKRYPAVNLYGPSGFSINVVDADYYNRPATNNLTSMSPMITVKYVLEKIEEYFDIKINFPEMDPDDVFFHPFTLDQPINFLNDKKLILFPRSYNLADLVPDIKVNDLLKALQIGYNCQMNFDADRRILHITNREPIINERDYLDITEFCSIPDDIQLSTKRGLKFSLEKDDGDIIENATDSPDDFIIGDGEREILVGFGAPAMKDHDMQDYWPGYFSFGTTPKYTCAINQPSETNFSFRLARYREEIMSDPFLDSTPFFWKGEGGLFEKYWKSTAEIENNPVTVRTNWLMTREEVFNIDWEKKLRLDRSDFLLQTFNVSLERNGLSMAECLFVKVPFFKKIEKPVYTYAWRGVESSKYCIREMVTWKEIRNTGYSDYEYIEEYIVETGASTGKVKANHEGDPDHIPPILNPDMCPLDISTADNGKLYIESAQEMNADDRVFINNVEYDFENFPYPHVMGSYTAVMVELSNTSQDIYKYTVVSKAGHLVTKTQTMTIYPGNVANTPFGLQTARVYRRLMFQSQTDDFDINTYNRLEISREII